MCSATFCVQEPSVTAQTENGKVYKALIWSENAQRKEEIFGLSQENKVNLRVL